MILTPSDVAAVTQLDSQVDAQIEAMNTVVASCAGMTAADVTEWAGFYASWKALHARWASFRVSATTAGLTTVLVPALWPAYAVAALVQAFGDLQGQMTSYANQLPARQTQLHTACPNYVIPSKIIQPPPDEKEKSLDTLLRIVEVSGTAALSLAVAYGIFKGIQLFSK